MTNLINQKSAIDIQRHSTAHLLAMATIKLFPDTQLGTGPVIDNGFYYDMKTPTPLTELDLKKIQKQVKKYIAQNLDFVREELPIKDAQALFTKHNQPYKCELIKKIEKTGATTVSIYHTGEDFIDLCEGPHVANTKEIDRTAIKITKLSGAYWQADENNDQMTRVYGVLFENKEALADYEKMLIEAKKRDHRKLGKELDLLVFSNLIGPGMPIFTTKGNIIREKIIEYSRQLNDKLGFGEVSTPNINKAELFKISGHYDKYKEDMMTVTSQYAKDEMFLKPMNCPQHTQIFASRPRSYKDLPIRYSDFSKLYRDERPGEISGIIRPRAFSQDDGHIFCREDQIEEELDNVLAAIKEALEVKYKINYKMRLSLRDEKDKKKYLGEDKIWIESQRILKKLLKKNEIEFFAKEGEAAFYGPKIDIVATDSLNREWQISTIQLDFSMPKRFKLEYTDKDGMKKTPVMIHRALIGSPDRFMGILIEHYAGAFPLWLAPVQIVVIPVSDKFNDYGQSVIDILTDAGFRTELRDESETLGKRIRTAQKEKIPYMLVVGEKEKETGTIAVRSRDNGDEGVIIINTLIEKLKNEK